MFFRKSCLALTLAITTALPCFAENCVVNFSHYDESEPDFGKMKREGIVAAIHEATYPPGTCDEKYTRRQRAACQAGMLWGAYHFANGSDPVRQADFFVDSVAAHWRATDPASRPAHILLVLDFERNTHYPGGTMTSAQAAAFVKRVRERTGKYPGIYSSENRIREVVNAPAVSGSIKRSLQNCWLWVANYHRKPEAVQPWKHWTMWQYTGDGVCELPRAAYPIALANFRNAERDIFGGGGADELRRFWEEHAWNPAS
jgi:lysozyme